MNKQVTDRCVLIHLLARGYVMHAPNHRLCELTWPLDDSVHYEVPSGMWHTLIHLIGLSEHSEPCLGLAYVHLHEPDCASGWCIVHTSNEEALRWLSTPQSVYNEMMASVDGLTQDPVVRRSSTEW